jgi:AraC-like DNA-binding protein
MLVGSLKYKGGREGLKKQQSSSKRLWLIAAAVVAILAVGAVPVLAATNEDAKLADAFARLVRLPDAEALAEYLALENAEDESCGPACSYLADKFAEAIGRDSAEDLAKELKLKGGEDELAQILHDSEDLNQLATAVGFDSPEALAGELEVESSDLALALRTYQSQLEELAELEGLAEDQGIEEGDFDELLEEYSNDPPGFAAIMGFDSVRALAEEVDLTPRELRQLLRDASPAETNKLEELAELREIAKELGYRNLGEFAEDMNVSRGELVEIFQEAKNPQDVAKGLGFESVGDFARHLGIDTSELDTLLDEAKSDDGVANTDGGEDEPANYDGEAKPATSVSQESEQEAESGEVNQSFTVTSEGDNSNQSAAVQGTANTGNAQSQTRVVQSGSEAEDIEVEGGSSIEVSPELDTQTQQAVEQAAAAAAEPEVQQATPAE